MYIIKEAETKEWFHGSPIKISNFNLNRAGNGTDQEGAGIYLTSDKEDALMYGKHIHKVILRSTKKLSTTSKPKKVDLIKLIKQAPNYLETLENWGYDNENENLNECLKGYLDYSDTNFDAIKTIEADFYSGAGKEYCIALSKIGYDYTIIDIKYNKILHAIVWNPKILEIEYAEINENVQTTKGGKGPVGSTVKAPGGEYIHQRKHDPDKYTDYRTIKKDGKLLRLGKTKDGKWEVQSVLTKE